MPQALIQLARALSIFLPFPIDGDWSGGWGITMLFWVGVFGFSAAMFREEYRIKRILDRLGRFNDDLEDRSGGFKTRRELERVARDLGREVPALRDPVLALADATFETDQGLFSTRSAEDFLDPLAFRELMDVPAGPARRLGRGGRLVGRDTAADLLDRVPDSEEVEDEGPHRPGHSWGDMVDLLSEPSEERALPPPPPRAAPTPKRTPPPLHFEDPPPDPRGWVTPALVAAGPSLLTAVGILGTFIGLVMGLDAGTSGGGDTGMPIDISTLVGGLHVSFRTSVIGLVASLSLTVVSKSLSGRIERELGRLTSSLDAGLVRATTHELLTHLYLRHEESTEALKWLKRELATDALQQTLEKAIRRQVRPLLVKLREATEAAPRRDDEAA